jgi:hypothetical protein
MNAVIVRARFDSRTLDASNSWEVRKGDLGLLRWKPHRKHPRFFEPRVVWDRDPEQKNRKVIVSSISVVGLQNAHTRVLLLPRFS